MIWENFGVGKLQRFFRIMFYIIFVMFMLVLCFYIVSELEGAQNKAQNELSGEQCPSKVDDSAANLDFYATAEKRNGDFHCFCKNMLWDEGINAL